MIKTDEIIATLKDKNADAAWITTPLNIFYSQVIEVNLMKDCLRYL